IVLSGPGRGIDETFGSAILASNEASVWNSVLRDWAMDPTSKLNESWRQMRTVLRAHTTTTALSIALRTAGIVVDGIVPERYSVELQNTSESVVKSVATQSVRPAAVVATELDSAARKLLKRYGI